jgi:hypothetical protein
MSEVVYSKKQIEPLIKKYGINAETNTVFQSIIKMFEGTPNYQIWALKAVFSKNLGFGDLVHIKEWADNNKTLIKSLSKQNIVAYSSNADFDLLNKEILGLNMISLVKNLINSFNTEQRHMLTKELKLDELNGLTAHSNRKFKSWYNILEKFNKLTANRKKNFISLCSAFRDVTSLKDGLAKAIEETYQWNKEDMLAFMANNTPNCKIVYNQGSVVILQIPDFDSSRKLCGGGRTGWCITRESSYFNSYVLSHTNPLHTQYFFFDFSKPESDEFSHIGFTVEDNRGIVNAHSKTNQSMLGDGIKYHGKYVNIHNAFNMYGIKMGTFLNLKRIKGFDWSLESVVEFISKHESDIAIAYNKDGRIILKALSNKGIEMLVAHTFINYKNFMVDSNGNSSIYILLDFNLEVNDDKAVLLMFYRKDVYKVESLQSMTDTFGSNIMAEKYLSKIGISTDEFINREKINPSILLHKLIDEGDEKGAIKLIEEQDDKFDVNFEFNDRIPIFSAINNRMYELFDVIVNHKSFDCSREDGYGENLLSSLLYAYETEEVSSSPEDERNIASMIKIILDSSTFDFNIQDISLDTAINIAAESPKMVWIVESLASKPNVDVNVINDFDFTALTNAIDANNVKAVEILLSRPDIRIRSIDKELAAKKGINLEKLASSKIEAIPSNNGSQSELSELFSKVLATMKR